MKIKEILKEQGRSQKWLAQQLAMSRQNLDLKLKGKVRISLNEAKKIADLLNVKIEELL